MNAPSQSTQPPLPLQLPEWLESDGLGGFGSSTSLGIPARRYHALYITNPGHGHPRITLLNAVDAAIITRSGARISLSSFFFEPGVVHPDGYRLQKSFSTSPWPTWEYAAATFTLSFELFIPHGKRMVLLRWSLRGADSVGLEVRPLLGLRSYHALQRADEQCVVSVHQGGKFIAVERPFIPAPCAIASNGAFQSGSFWYYRFRYEHERDRGFDSTEDLFSPGVVRFNLTADTPAVLAAGVPDDVGGFGGPLAAHFEELATSERARRKALGTRLDVSAEAFLIRDDDGPTVIAGYPWFTDWGRDTFIALRGLCLARGKLTAAAEILLRWSAYLSDGMLPNRFPDAGTKPDYNSVDAALWFVVASAELLALARKGDHSLYRKCAPPLTLAIEQIIESYRGGTRYGIRMAHDHLIAAGEPGSQLTWMDAKVNDYVVTPRVGKPVEIQALWINALMLGAELRPEEDWRKLAQAALESFNQKFWNAETHCLFDVVDVDHFPGNNDGKIRPNQVFAAGGLPFTLVTSESRRDELLDTVERELLTPAGPRTLAPGDPHYVGYYSGGPVERDRGYHQGTVWPWLMGAFVEAWVKARGGERGAKRDARKRFLPPMLSQLDHAGLDHLAEICDGNAPHTPRGAPFQAWSLAELIRLDRVVLAEERA